MRAWINRIKSIPAMMKDRDVSLGKKALIVFGIIYLFLPVDLVPPVLFPIGEVDDIVLWIFILSYLKDTLDNYWTDNRTVDFSGRYRDAIVDENATVEEETGGDEKSGSADSAGESDAAGDSGDTAGGAEDGTPDPSGESGDSAA